MKFQKFFTTLAAIAAGVLAVEADTPQLYMVIDLSGGKDAVTNDVTYLDAVPDGGWTDEYKTTKLVMRYIEPGTFTMGSPTDELGRYGDEWPQHQVTLTKGFYIGVFEVTQKQAALIAGINCSTYKGDMRPVETITWYEIRGGAMSDLTDTSIIAKLRARTGLTTIDLPTEAQWEYACRAGTTTALNNGKNLTDTGYEYKMGRDTEMDKLGRYGHNGGHQVVGTVDHKGGIDIFHTVVGMYEPNAWGLYDMHGNVWETCRDVWTDSVSADDVTDPTGPETTVTNKARTIRGGGWNCHALACRSAYRFYRDCESYSKNYTIGFRLSMTVE